MFLIDYFSCTILHESISFDDVLHFLDLEDCKTYFVDIGSRMRYERCLKFGNMNILLPYEKRKEMGIFINFTGQGCREYENCFGNLYTIKNKENEFQTLYHENATVWKRLFGKLINLVNNGYKINVTRFDIALDDFDGKLNLELIQQKLINEEYVSKFKKWSDIECQTVYDRKGGSGKSIYLGSKKSSSYCKFYDKLVEQKIANKNDDVVLEKLDELNHWIRFELTFKDSLAIFMCNMIYYSNDIDKDIADYANKCIRFVDLDDVRKSRCSISEFWSEFLNSKDISKYNLVKSDLVGYDKTYLWFKKSLAPSLFALYCTYQNPNNFYEDMFLNGAGRLNEHHQQIINCKSVGKKLSNADTWQNASSNWVDVDIELPTEEYKEFR